MGGRRTQRLEHPAENADPGGAPLRESLSHTERSDDREQLADNYFLDHRFRREIESRRASLDPGLFYRFALGGTVEFICIDTSVGDELGLEHYFDAPSRRDWVEDALRPGEEAAVWRIPFSHHPPFCAGPSHDSTPGMQERLVPLFEDAGVRLVLSGHEHNFQHSVRNDVHYIVSGAGGKLREEPPTDFEGAGTRAWAAAGHFLLVDASPERIVVHPVAGSREDGSLERLELRDPHGAPVSTPLVID